MGRAVLQPVVTVAAAGHSRADYVPQFTSRAAVAFAFKADVARG